MLRNNNQAAVSRIYHRMLKQNKVRNVIVILAIVLTTFMFTAVFTLGFSIAKNLNQMQLRLLRGYAVQIQCGKIGFPYR